MTPVQTEVMQLTISATGGVASGKTAALVSIIDAIQDMVGPGLEVWWDDPNPTANNEILVRHNQEHRSFDRNAVLVSMEVKHHGT